MLGCRWDVSTLRSACASGMFLERHPQGAEPREGLAGTLDTADAFAEEV